ncbi:hypothetical protein HYS93_04615 [Candidatus Daviesbacteria bacterium]|nr:hypothetical protein [Candidatus Daviesbacteria bacterium]
MPDKETIKATAKDIGKVILLTLGVSGVVVLAATSPGFGYLLKEINKKRFKNYRPFRINQTMRRLEKQQLISLSEYGDQVKIELTDKGRKRILSYKLGEMSLKKTKWDGIWRIVIFDIPEHKKVAREFLRKKMKEFGFYPLQKSVLVTPWECKDEVDFVKHYYQVGDHVNLVYAKAFDQEEKVKKYFQI